MTWTLANLAGHGTPAPTLALTVAGGVTCTALALGGFTIATAGPITSVGCGATQLSSAVGSAGTGATLSLAANCDYKLTTGLTAKVSMTILGNGSTLRSAAGSQAVSMLTVEAGTVVSLSNLTMTGGRATGASGGSAIVNKGTLTIVSSAFTADKVPSGSGGAIASTGVLAVSHSRFIGDEAKPDGGAIDSTGPLTVTDSAFTDNTATGSGGAIYADYSPVTVEHSKFIGNSALGGGAIAVIGSGSLTVTDGDFVRNRATGTTGTGGAIVTDGAFTTTIGSSSFKSNKAGSDGGAVDAFEGTLTVAHTEFSGDSAASDGGAMALFGGSTGDTVTITAGGYQDDSATGSGAYGGAIYADGSSGHSTLTITGAAFVADRAKLGDGGAIWTGGVTASVGGTRLAGNDATEGGAIYNAGTAALSHSVVSRNKPDNCAPSGSVPGC